MIICDGVNFMYKELNEWVNELVYYLVEEGIWLN